eukprot:CCRYP_020265-RD/>CCRYP_020265-RD protein AED:0.12 eAED:0.12 QI:73/1/1/1/0.2/0.16/6/3214/534
MEDAARSLFDTYCNGEDGLMDINSLMNVPFVKDLLEEGDLLVSELEEIWSSAPKAGINDDRINSDGFVIIYQDIDDMFEEVEEQDDDDDESIDAVAQDDAQDSNQDLDASFASLTKGASSLSMSELRQWEEITSLIDKEGMLGEDEFQDLWGKSVGDAADTMDYNSFVVFNEALDDLFVFEDVGEEELDEDASESGDVMEEEDEAVQESDPSPNAQPKPIITDTSLPPAVLFSQLADENYLVSQEELLSRWGELREMLSVGDLTRSEFDELWSGVEKAPGAKDKLDEDGFLMLYEKIDELFEDEDEMEGKSKTTSSVQSAVASQATEVEELKEELLELIQDIDKLSQEESRQPCGLDCTELEQERVLEVVSELEREPYNRVRSRAVPKEELVGNWDLIYSSSSTMKYNEGLSGLAGGLTKFGGLQQRLTATKYLSDVEYVEQVLGKLGGQSFEVRITGDWDLRTEVSLFTGKPANVLSVTPDQVKYGPRSDKADHWKSLGPMNLLVLSYLDEDLRIMRGNTSTDTLFIFRRSKQ